MAPNCIVENNRIFNSLGGAITTRGCTVVHGNLVKNANASTNPITDNGNAGYDLGDLSATYATLIQDVSNNRVVDDQFTASPSTLCSVATATSTTCLTSGSSYWLYDATAPFTPDISNRYVFINNLPYQLHNALDTSHLELEQLQPFFGSGTAYGLHWTFVRGFWLRSNIVNFVSNFGNLGLLGYSTGYPGGGIVIDTAGKTIQNIFGNFFFSPRQAIAIRSDGAAPNYSYYNQSHGPVGGVSCNQGNCASSPTTLYTIGNVATSSIPGITFEAHVSIACTSVVSTATVSVTISYTDVSGTAQTSTSGTATCTTLGASSVAAVVLPFRMYGNSSVKYNVNVANTPQYQASVMVYQETDN